MDKLAEIWGWLSTNKEWVFGGIGVIVIVGIGRVFLRLFQRPSGDQVQSQSGGAFSKNSQVMIKKDDDKA